MIIQVSSGERHVRIKVKGHGPKALARAEAAAARLMAAGPPPPPAEPVQAFGYSTTSDHQLS